MSNNKTKGYIVIAIIFVVFSVIAFAAPFSMTGAFWLGYIFGAIAIAAQIFFFGISFTKGEDVKSKFYGFPIARISVIYLVVQMLISFIEMAAAKILPTWISVIVNVLIAAAAAVGSIAADVMREEIVRQDVQIKSNVGNMRGLQSLSASLVGICQDAGLKKTLQNLADDFKYSDPVSSEATAEKEQELNFLVNEIQRALIDGDVKAANDFCLRAKTGLTERNRICKLAK